MTRENDLISRQAVLDLFQDNVSTLHNYARVWEAVEDMPSVIPSVNPQEPKTGHWICDRANVRCSHCGRGYKDFYGKASIASYNFCPNCGCRMVEPQESEEKE